ncbi:hypothetical protein J6590_015797 [Homalodisca vitripennis]|nr:hypothetical protein J6590_015797 [Homalodisca vitripennis]
MQRGCGGVTVVKRLREPDNKETRSDRPEVMSDREQWNDALEPIDAAWVRWSDRGEAVARAVTWAYNKETRSGPEWS